MTTEPDLRRLPGAIVVGSDGGRLGEVVDVYVSADGRAEGAFVTVATDRCGAHASFVPLAGARSDGDTLTVAYAKELVLAAPRLEGDEQLSVAQEQRLYAHYSLTSAGRRMRTIEMSTDIPGAVGPDTAGLITDGAIIGSQERLRVDTLRIETGRARLRKYVVPETVGAQVRRERTDLDAAAGTGRIPTQQVQR